MQQNLNFRPEIEMMEPRYLAGGLILNGTTFWIIGGVGTSKEYIDDCFDSDDEDNDLLESGYGSGCHPLEMFDHQYILKTSEFITLDNPSVKGKCKHMIKSTNTYQKLALDQDQTCHLQSIVIACCNIVTILYI